MTSKLKCPFCAYELQENRTTNLYCPICGLVAPTELWQALIESRQQLKMLEPIVASLQGRADINAEVARDSCDLIVQWYEKYEQSQKDLEESQQATLQNAQTVLEIHKDLEIAQKALEDMQHWLGVIRCSMVSHLNNQNNTLFEHYETDPTVQNIDKAKCILKHYIEQIEHKDK
jgi:hypothetical protein